MVIELIEYKILILKNWLAMANSDLVEIIKHQNSEKVKIQEISPLNRNARVQEQFVRAVNSVQKKKS